LTELRNDHNCHSKSGSELGSGGFEQRLKRELSLGRKTTVAGSSGSELGSRGSEIGSGGFPERQKREKEREKEREREQELGEKDDSLRCRR
jgi:hypothetical protein